MDHSHKPFSFLAHKSWYWSILKSLSNAVLDEEKFSYSYNMTDSPVFPVSDPKIPVMPMLTSSLLMEYARSFSNVLVRSMRFVLTRFEMKPAPQVAQFSSRGPDPIFLGLLKPDILAPGIDVLAAVPPFRNYQLVTDYQLYSGTSMTAPHVAGLAALLRAAHLEWSPVAIRSAIMTIAYTMDNKRSILTDELTTLLPTPLDFGAGHINPNRAMDPGLIYDLDFQDYRFHMRPSLQDTDESSSQERPVRGAAASRELI